MNKPSLLRKSILAIIFSLFVFLSFRTLQSHIFSIHFVDEDENIIAGHYMVKGEKFYSDIFSHKQPLPAVFSALINKIFKPNSLFLLIKRHREAVFFYSVFWWIIFLFEFGFSGLIFSVAIEISKRFLLGDLFLAESLVIFPIAYVLGYLRKLSWESKLGNLKRHFFLFSLISIPFQLFVLIPFTAAVILYFLWWEKFSIRTILTLCLIFILFALSFLPFVSYYDYFINTKSAIAVHYFQDAVNQGAFKQLSLSFLRPLAILTSFPKSEFGIFNWFLSAVYLFSLIYLFFKKRKNRFFLLFSVFLLGLVGTRLVDLEATFYNGFHGFPWFSAILFLTIIQLQALLSSLKTEKERPVFYTAFFLVLLIFSCSGRFFIKDYFREVNRETDFWVNFSRFLSTGRVIKTLSAKDDKLMVIPVEQLLYFTSELPHQNRFLYTYEWVFLEDQLKKELKKDLEDNLPAFVYYDYSSVGNDAKALFGSIFTNYVQLRQDDTTSPVLIRADKLDNLEDWQIQGIKNFGFSIPM